MIFSSCSRRSRWTFVDLCRSGATRPSSHSRRSIDSAVSPGGAGYTGACRSANEQGKVAPLGHRGRVGQGLGDVGEPLEHLLAGPQVELALAVPHAAGVRQDLAGVDAQEHVVGPRVVGVDVMDIVGGHQRDAHLAGQGDDQRPHPPLLLDAVVLDLEVEVLGAEDLAVLVGRPARAGRIARQQPQRDFALQAGRHAQEARRMLGQHCLVDARPVVEAVERGRGRQAQEVPEPRLVAGQQDEVVAGVLRAGERLAVLPAAGGDVGLVADDGLEARLRAGADRTRSRRTGSRDR